MYLQTAPRKVPIAFQLAVLRWNWLELFVDVMVIVTPIALWMSIPQTICVLFAGLLVGGGIYRFKRYQAEIRPLRSGEPDDPGWSTDSVTLESRSAAFQPRSTGSYPYAVFADEDGEWVDTVPDKMSIGIAATIVLYGFFLMVAVVTLATFWF